jgi:hypothetical protein
MEENGAELEEARETNSEAAELRARLEGWREEEELVRLVGLPLVLYRHIVQPCSIEN